MSDSASPTSPQAGSNPPSSSFSPLRLGLLVLGALAAGAAAYAVVVMNNKPPQSVDTVTAIKSYLEEQGRYDQLAAGFTDADGDLVADPPSDAAKFMNPDEIAFTVVATDDPDAAEENWRPFLEHLAKVTGKKVAYAKQLGPPAAAMPDSAQAEQVPPAGTAEDDESAPIPPSKPTKMAGSLEQQRQAVKDGKLHVTAFNTGAVRAAVNEAGFVPLFCPANADGKYTYEMEVIVPASSSAKSPADLRGQTWAFVAMSSNSGAKAPLVLLKQQFGMVPGRDYDFVISGSHDRSIDGVAAGKFAAASVANDILRRKMAANPELAEKVRSIYKSNPFPPLTFGVPHDLDPKLRADIERAFETFSFEGNTVGTKVQPGRVKFARVNYKKDFEFVLEIDEKLAAMANEK